MRNFFFFFTSFLIIESNFLIAQEGKITLDQSYEKELRDNLIKIKIIQQNNTDTIEFVNFSEDLQLTQLNKINQNFQFIVETKKYFFVSKFQKIPLIDSDYVIRFKRNKYNFFNIYYNLLLFEKVSATGLPIYIKRYRKKKW